mgnify:CR=1 FL=1
MKWTKLYVSDYLFENNDLENNDFAFFGTDNANVYVYSISKEEFIFKIPSPFFPETLIIK